MLNLAIEYVPLGTLTPYAKNAKMHPQKQIENIKTSIQHCGMCDPIGVWGDKNTIVEGHGRYEALKQLGMTERVPIIRLDHLTDKQRREYTLIHNKTTMDTGFDMDVLQSEIGDLDFSGFDIDWGIAEEEAAPKKVTQDDVPEVDETEEPITALGDLWRLGNHLLLCADSTDPLCVERLMGEEHARLLFTSPPYSDMREYNGGKNLSVASLCGFMAAYAPYCDLLAVNLGIQRHEGEVVQYWDAYIDQAHRCGMKLLAWNVWDKLMAGSVGQQKAMIPIRHEWIFVFGEQTAEATPTWRKKPESIRENGASHTVRQKDGSLSVSTRGITDREYKVMESVVKLESVTEICSERGTIRKEHPATFPVALPAEYIQAFVAEGEVVAEPFGGSGTTLIACEQLGRVCRSMELDPRYCDVAVRRWEKLTGRKAERIKREEGDRA